MRGATVSRPSSVALIILLGVLAAGVSFAVLTGPARYVSCALAWAMLAIAASDARRFIVPDVLSLPMIPAGLLATRMLADPLNAQVLAHLAAGIVAAFALWLLGHAYERLRGRSGIGFGDVKLAAVAGAWTGPEGVIHILLIASLTALIAVALYALIARQMPSGRQALPFATFLAPAIWLVWVLQTMP